MDRRRILIADQSPAVRQELIELLQEDSDIVAVVETGESVFPANEAFSPSVILLGVGFPDISGFEVARRLRRCHCEAKIIIISLYESPDLARAALDVGASGYVFISRLLEDLPAAITAACEGRTFDPELLR